MKALIVHLSIHVTNSLDPILQRAGSIAKAVQNIEGDLAAAIIAVSGDLAYSGKADQYLEVWAFLLSLSDQLSSRLASNHTQEKIPVSIVAIPGNHDCDFSNEPQVRNIVIGSVVNDVNQAKDKSIVDTCLSVQDSFFGALADWHPTGLGAQTTAYDRRLSYDCLVPIGDKSIRFLCFNTAWLSRLHEEQGKLVFPDDAVIAERPAGDAIIGMFHHPYNWMKANVANGFRKRIESVADVILTGHEHDPLQRSQRLGSGERNMFLEGAALQDPLNPMITTGFNVAVLDLAKRKQKIALIQWNGTRYVISAEENPHGDANNLVWEDFQVTGVRDREEFQLLNSFEEHLNDAGANLYRKSRGVLRLTDIFIYPDLREAATGEDAARAIINGTDALSYVLKSSKLLITGDHLAGKTSLAKILFLSLRERGYVPILLTGTKELPVGDRLERHMLSIFENQYDFNGRDAYRQMDRSQRVVIVDDYHLLVLNDEKRREFIRTLSAYAGKVVLFGDDFPTNISEMAFSDGGSSALAGFDSCRIMPLGHLRRDDLVEKWLLLESAAELDVIEFVHRRDEITGKLNNLISQSRLPPYPIYVLAILQADEDGAPVDSRISTYGAYYELIIRGALARHRKPGESNADLNYLAYFGYHLFVGHPEGVDWDAFQAITMEYERRYDFRRDATSLLEDFKQAGILTDTGGIIAFKYEYVYYYFVASWLRDHINESEIRKCINRLAESLYVRDSASTFLFLAHLSKDPFLIASMLNASRSFYADAEPASFSDRDDMQFLSGLMSYGIRLVYRNSNLEEYRKKRLALLDQQNNEVNPQDEQRNANVEMDEQHRHYMQSVHGAFKTLEVLGQILKNFAGSLEAELKEQIAQECYSLGLRVARDAFQQFQLNEAAILNGLSTAVKELFPKMPAARIDERARKVFVQMLQIMGMSIINRISDAVADSDLRQTYRRLWDRSNMPAMGLIHAAVNLQVSTRNFPRTTVEEVISNVQQHDYASSILAFILIAHFSKYTVDERTKHIICEKINVDYKKVAGTREENKITP